MSCYDLLHEPHVMQYSFSTRESDCAGPFGIISLLLFSLSDEAVSIERLPSAQHAE